MDGQQRLTALYLVPTGEVPLRFDLEKKRFTFSSGENHLRLDILRDATGGRRPFQDAASELFLFHTTQA